MPRQNNFLYFLRKNVIIVLTLSLYILSVYYFFFDSRILWGLVFSIFFFVLAQYFVIELKSTQETNMFFIILVACIFLLLLNGFNNIFYSFGIVFFNLAVFFLFWGVGDEVYNRIQISTFKVFNAGIPMYALFLSLTFAVNFLGTYRTFDLTCNQIYTQMSNFSKYTLKYFGFSSYSPEMTDTKLKDVVKYMEGDNITGNDSNFTGDNNNFSGSLLTGDNTTGNYITGSITTGSLISLTGDNLTGSNISNNNINNNNTENIDKAVIKNDKYSFSGVDNIKFSSLFDLKFRKGIIINQIMENRQLLNENMCYLIVTNIKSKYQDPKFQFAVLFMMFILFYPLIRIVLFILAILNFIFFGLFRLGKIYKFSNITEEVEIIE